MGVALAIDRAKKLGVASRWPADAIADAALAARMAQPAWADLPTPVRCPAIAHGL
jgi:hypothetical protein